MTEQSTAYPSAQPQEKKKSGCLTKLVKFFLYFALVVVALWLVLFLLFDRKITPVQVDDAYAEVDVDKGEVPDYRALYDEFQRKDSSPLEENGWFAILQAFGPKAIYSDFHAGKIRWEDLPTDKSIDGRQYAEFYRPLCEKFELDPTSKPVFYDRLELVPYLVKNGARGDEPAREPASAQLDKTDSEAADDDSSWSESSDDQAYEYWENGEKYVGKIDRDAANDAYMAPWSGPWTPQDYPIVAQWFAENEDRFALVAEAARKPKFHCWHFPPSAREGSFISLDVGDVFFLQNIGREVHARANLRVGSGDISGAVDDMETLANLSRGLLDADSPTLIEKLVGLTLMQHAAGVQLYGVPSQRPTAEERDRIVAIWRDNFGDEILGARIERAKRAEYVGACATFAELLQLVGEGKDVSLGDMAKDPSALISLLTRATPIDGPKTHEIFRTNYRDLMNADPLEREERWKELAPSRQWRKGASSWLASVGLRLLFPAIENAYGAFKRCDCSLKMNVVGHAIWAYYDDVGTFPPTFSVDANGAPLHSWRVLILPYLGDDAKALYDQIRLDEPWNSEHNVQFHKQMPDVYRCVCAKDAAEGETIYSLLVSQDGVFDRSGVGKDPIPYFQRSDRVFRDQIMLAESPEPYCWMRPDGNIDLDQAPNVGEEGTMNTEAPLDQVSQYRKLFGMDAHAEGCDTVDFGGATKFLGSYFLSDDAKMLHWLRGIPEPEEEEDQDAQSIESTDEEE